MQRTIRILRIALPIAFVAFLGVIALNWTSTRRQRDRSAADPIVATRTGERPQVEAKGFEDTQTINGRVVSRIRARRVVAYSSNWNTLEDVDLTIFRPNGLTYMLSCPQAQFNSKTKEADAKGGVKVTSSDGVEISTAEIHFNGNELTNHIPVQFKIDRWTGNAGALELNVEGETLRLFETMTAQMVPVRPTDVPMSLKSSEGLFRRKDNEADFTNAVQMTRLADRLNGDRIVGKFTQDRKTLIGLEGSGRVVLEMSSNTTPGEDLGGRKVINCDRFYSELSPDAQISAINAVGDVGPAHAVLDGPPRRDITAKSFRIALSNKVVTELKADTQVVMKEFGDTERDVNADRVFVYFDQNSHKATSALLDGSVRYSDPKNQASAIRANYDIAGDRVVLTAQPGFDPTVISEGNTVRAKQIEFSPRAGTARATGSVIAQLVSKDGGPSADATNVFPAGKPVFVNADTLLVRQSNKTAVFTGNVRAWQETNTLLAQELQVQGSGDSLSARGNVRTILYNMTPNDPAHPAPARITSVSDQLFARKNERRIDLAGNVKVDDDQRSLTAEKAAFFFDANRKMERVETDGKVVMVDRSASRKGTGDKAVYNVIKRTVLVSGNPATMSDPTRNLQGKQIAIDIARNKVEVIGSTAGTAKTAG